MPALRRPNPPSGGGDRYRIAKNLEDLEALPKGEIVGLKPGPRKPGTQETTFAADNKRLDALIKSIEQDLLKEDEANFRISELVAEGKDYLPNRRAQLEALGMPALSSGEPLAGRLDKIVAMEDRLGNLGELVGNIPAPLIERVPSRVDGQLRRHTMYETSPITGQRNVVPYMDPGDPSKPVITELGLHGDHDIPGGHDQAMEHVGENVLKLMGERGAMNRPRDAFGNDLYQAADLQSGPVDNPFFYDVETYNTRDDNMNEAQMYTLLGFPFSNPISRERPHIKGRKLREAIENRARDKNLSLEGAVEDLIGDGTLFKFDDRAGKVLKGEVKHIDQDTGRTVPGADRPETVMDGVIALGMTPSDRREAERYKFREGVEKYPYAHAPAEVGLINIPTARDELNAVVGEVGGNFVIKPRGRDNLKINAILPDNSKAVRNLAEEDRFKYVRQILRDLPYIQT